MVGPVRVFLASILLALGAASGASQETTGRTVLATVVDVSGKPLIDWGPDDFVVSEGDQNRDVLDVHIADYPVTVLIDDGIANSASMEAIKSAVVRFVTRIGERPVAIGVLSDPTKMIASFDDERSDVISRIGVLSAGATGSPATLPAVAHAARLLAETGAPFSAIVVVTAKPIDATEPVQGDLLPSILDSSASVHVIESRPPAPAENAAEVPDLLRVLAEQTHGQYTTIFSSASFAVALDRLADRLAGELMIQYLIPPAGRPGDVRVGVRRLGAHVVGLGVSK